MARIAYLGPQGTFTHSASLQFMMHSPLLQEPSHQLISQDTIPEVLDAIRDNYADFGCVPIENSLEGSILPTLDNLACHRPLQIYAEITLPVRFCIIHRPGIDLQAVQRVAAHPIAAAQIRQWLTTHLQHAQIIPANSNAAAAHLIDDHHADAAVTTAWSAQESSCIIAAHNLIDEPSACTRFVLVGLPGPPPESTGYDRTSLVVQIPNTPGALVEALSEFAIRGINLTRIESRPTRVEMGAYRFFIDFCGHSAQQDIQQVLTSLAQKKIYIRYLGSWPITLIESSLLSPLHEHYIDESTTRA